MAVIAFTSAKGSPGVTTTVLALALVWHRPVLVIEADTVGGSSILAGWLRATVPHDRSVLDAAIAHHNGQLGETLHSLTIPLPPEQPTSPKRLLAAIPRSVHGPAVDPLWQPLGDLARTLEDAGMDVLVDAGRLGARHAPMPLLRSADAVLVVSRATLPSISAVAAVLDQLRADLSDHGQGEDTLALLMVGQPGVRPTGELYSPRDVRRELGTPVVGTVVFDPVAAEVLHRGAAPGRRFDRSNLMRSARSVAEAADHLAQAHLDRLDPGRTAPENRGRNV